MQRVEALKQKSIWWALGCVFWYWRGGLPLFVWRRWWNTAWWHGFHLRACYNYDPQLAAEDDDPEFAVSTDMSYWEE